MLSLLLYENSTGLPGIAMKSIVDDVHAWHYMPDTALKHEYLPDF